ncbi:glycosyltransferase family 4 protein [Marinactinospora rubrisoli]|uniref:Glycosyltransferase family 4 protein n=1 Tax=Marinactinospora rubrisoli TaxID=2715399 RepID=A0ABW2KIE8_9ACTN
MPAAPAPLPPSTPPLRVALVAESFLPQLNGVSNSVCRVAEHLAERGHRAVIIAPGAGPTGYAGFPVLRLPSVPLPGYRTFPLAIPSPRLVSILLRGFAPDVVHLASPALLGHAALVAAQRWAWPTVAAFQTDLAGFARRHGIPRTDLIWSYLHRLHAAVDRTLAPSSATLRDLAERGFPRLGLWPRGVDTERFHPRHRDDALRRRLAPNGELIVGYVGRLSKEKRVDLLTRVADLPGVRLVVVGDGPERARLERALPGAEFLGLLSGAELSRAYACLDLFVHTGADETFCQAIQEALASGVPVVAPAAGGPLDLVEPGRNGLLFPAEEPDGPRAAVERLAAAPELRRRLADAARPSVRARTWESVNDLLLGHYRAVIAAGPTAPAGVPVSAERRPVPPPAA